MIYCILVILIIIIYNVDAYKFLDKPLNNSEMITYYISQSFCESNGKLIKIFEYDATCDTAKEIIRNSLTLWESYTDLKFKEINDSDYALLTFTIEEIESLQTIGYYKPTEISQLTTNATNRGGIIAIDNNKCYVQNGKLGWMFINTYHKIWIFGILCISLILFIFGLFGYYFSPKTCKILRCIMPFALFNFVWLLIAYLVFNICQSLTLLMTHEIGHAIGLGHTEDVKSIMYSNSYTMEKVCLEQEDIKQVSELYNYIVPMQVKNCLKENDHISGLYEISMLALFCFVLCIFILINVELYKLCKTCKKNKIKPTNRTLQV